MLKNTRRLLNLGPLLTTVWAAFPVASATAEREVLDLLRLPGASPAYCSDVRLPLSDLNALTDGNTQTAVVLTFNPKPVWEIIFSLGNETCTPQRLEIQLATTLGEPGSEAGGRVEAAVTDMSDRVGFQDLWSMPWFKAAGVQSVDLPGQAARWIRLRFTPPAGAGQVRLAEVRVWGVAGRPKSLYQFKETPAQALDVLRQVKSAAGEASLSQTEQALFADMRDGSLHAFLPVEAALIASGVHDAGARKVYLEKLNAWAQTARRETAACATPLAKAERLLAWMHAGPARNGYQPTQSSLAVLLDEQTFNCVSVTLLFNYLARSLDLDTRAVEVPTHVFSVIYGKDGGTCDVETTSAGGVDPGAHPEVVRGLLAEKQLVYVSARNPEMRREVGELGLAAAVYYNRGVLCSQEKKYPEALKADFCCLSLDPEFPQAVQNTLATLNNWSLSLVEQKQYAEAVRVVTSGMDLVPQDLGFQDTRRLVYTRWAEEARQAGRTEEALAILRQAALADPGGDFERRQAWVFIAPAALLSEQKQWARALALDAPGRERLPPAARAEWEAWRQGTYLTWMQAALGKQDFADAAQAMETACREAPQSTEYAQNLAFVVQSWAVALYRRQGRPPAEALLQRYHDRFPGAWMSQAAAGYAGVVVEDLRRDPDFAARAASVLADCEPFLGAAPGVNELLQGFYEQAAQEHMQNRDFAGAADIYRCAQASFPQDPHWRQGEEAARAQAQRLSAGDEPVKPSRTEDPAVGKSADAYDARGQAALGHAAWSQATAIYDEALQRYPQHARLQNNAGAAWDQWAEAEIRQKHWDAALTACEQALSRALNPEHFKQKIIYLVQTGGQESLQAEDVTSAGPWLRRQRRRFVELKALPAMISVLYTRALGDLPLDDTKRYLSRGRDLLKGRQQALDAPQPDEELVKTWCDRFAQDGLDRHNWQAALDILAAARSLLPYDEHLRRNEVAVWNIWAQTFIQASQWDLAEGIYTQALQRFPQESIFINNLNYCKSQKEDKVYK
ncbi:MAG: hypothetical protein HGA76_09020 [Candidatus Firestonebacteria bacterium]|nr:hypothetical protein [Candidatus Firestonebacteria bacterium]